MSDILTITTHGPGLVDITRRAAAIVRNGAGENTPESGLAHFFIQHTSASLLIQENADPDVCDDLVDHFDRLAPRTAPWRHTAEGPDDMPAHVKTALTATSLCIPFAHGELLLGTWQGLYLFEHRDGTHQRRIVVTLMPRL